MRRLFFTVFFTGLSALSFSQDYAYSFIGEITPEKQEQLNAELVKVDKLSSFKLKYKEDSQKGELILWIEAPTVSGEVEYSFSPISVKNIFLDLGLSPAEFRTIND